MAESKEEQVKTQEEKKDIDKNQEFLESIKELKALASKDGPSSGEEIVQRLISDPDSNPYEVMMLGPEASEEEIKKQHKMVILFLIKFI